MNVIVNSGSKYNTHDLDNLGDIEGQLHVNKLIIDYDDCSAVATRIGKINEYVDFLSKRKFTCVPQFGIEPLWTYCLNQSNPSVT